jgi:hypothetical protein
MTTMQATMTTALLFLVRLEVVETTYEVNVGIRRHPPNQGIKFSRSWSIHLTVNFAVQSKASSLTTDYCRNTADKETRQI